MRALKLDANNVCTEVGLSGICYELIHLVPLGGNEPVRDSLFKPIEEPSVTTPISFERVVLNACGARVDLDYTASRLGEPLEVFRQLDLQANNLTPDSLEVNDTAIQLYRLLLARDPNDEELAAIVALAGPVDGTPLQGFDIAKLMCFAIGTQMEFLLQ